MPDDGMFVAYTPGIESIKYPQGMGKVLTAESDSTIHFNATYDNTLNNPYNPSNLLQTVFWGETTYDEMFIVGLNWVPYQAGDENIIIGENTTTGIEKGATARKKTENLGGKDAFFKPKDKI